MILRLYQERAIARCRAEYARGRRAVLLVSPTGSGKGAMASAIVLGAVARGRRVLIGAHRIELVNQLVRNVERSGVPSLRVIRAEHDAGPPDAPVTVASIPTLTTPRWLSRLPEADLVVLDECHHAPSAGWLTIASRYQRARLLGLTATPCRGDGVGLGHVFDALVVGATIRELTPEYLVPLRTWAPPEVLEAGRLAMTPLEAYRRHAAGRRAIVFAPRVADAERYAAELTAAGVPAACVHGELGEAERAAVLERLTSGELRAVTNVDVWTEGTDIPPADACILACSPGHVGRLLQMAGRVLRPSPATGKRDAVLVDLCGAVLVHGTPDMDRTYSLEGRGISGPARAAIRQCTACGAVIEAGPATCPTCGAALVGKPRRLARSARTGVEEVVDLAAKRATTLRRNLLAGGVAEAEVERVAAAIAARRLRW